MFAGLTRESRSLALSAGNAGAVNAGALSVRYASAMDELPKYREREADGFTNIDVKERPRRRGAVGKPNGW